MSSLGANVYFFVIKNFQQKYAKIGFQECVRQVVETVEQTGQVKIGEKTLIPLGQPIINSEPEK